MAPQFSSLDPKNGETAVPIVRTVSFEVTDSVAVDATKTLSFIQGVLAYENETEYNGYNVVRTAITQGYRYEITSPDIWPYGSEIMVEASARDTSSNLTSVTWSFFTLLNPDCFTGPLNDTEEALYTPFTSLDYTERLRSTLLQAAVTRPDTVTAARVIFLDAHSQELAPVLRDLVSTPTNTERASRLCARATNLQISNALRRKVNLLPGAIHELQSLGLPREHAEMLRAYEREDQPNTEVPLACLIVLLAKALE